MKIVILLASIALTSANALNPCNGIVINGIMHEEETIAEDLLIPHHLAIDYNTDVLYYAYLRHLQNINESGIAYLNLKTNEAGIIKGFTDGFSCTVDQQSHNVYFGGNGIHKLIPGTNITRHTNITDKHIYQLFYKDGIYFTSYLDGGAYLFKAGEVIRLEIGKPPIKYIAVDSSNNIFYSDNSGLFCYTEDGKTIRIGDSNVTGFTSDASGKLYFTTRAGLFAIDEKTKEVKELARLEGICGAAIESDGSIIYATERKVFRLKSTGKECVTEQE